MNIKLIIIIILTLSFSSCKGQEMEKEIKDSTINVEFKMFIIPSGGGDLGYEIRAGKKHLTFLTRNLEIKNSKIVLGLEQTVQKKELNNREVLKIIDYQNLIKKMKFDNKDENRLDVWSFEISFEKDKKIRTNSYILSLKNSPKIINEFIVYIISLSPTKIKLDGFS